MDGRIEGRKTGSQSDVGGPGHVQGSRVSWLRPVERAAWDTPAVSCCSFVCTQLTGATRKRAAS